MSVLYAPRFPRIHLIVSAIPSAKVYCCCQSVSSFSFTLLPSRRFTSLFSGRSRCSSQTIFAFGLICAMISFARSPMEIYCPVAILISSFPASSWEMIVGITALADCLGPKVLNGRTIETGSWKLR